MKRKPILDENTRLSLAISNVWPIVVAVFLFGVSFSMYMNRMTAVETKLDLMIEAQKELSADFKLWKGQYEKRLGLTELDVNRIATMMNVKISDNSGELSSGY